MTASNPDDSHKVHDASARKLSQARARGDIARGPTVAAAAGLLGFGAALLGLAPRLMADVATSFRAALSAAAQLGDVEPSNVLSGSSALAKPLSALALDLLGLLAAPASAFVLVALVQAGALRSPFAAAPRAPFFARAWPWLTRAHWSERAFELLAACVLLGCALVALGPSLPGVLALAQQPTAHARALGSALVLWLAARLSLALLALGVLDFVLRALRRRQRLRMSRRELEQERRETEGDPHLQGERRRRARELANEAGLAELARASLLLHDDSGRALALRYVPGQHVAPILWVKGRGALAARMLEQAALCSLPVHRDLSLLSALDRLELSEPIPADLYPRVARLIAGARDE